MKYLIQQVWLLFMIVSWSVCAQQSTKVVGVVKDKASQQPLEFVSVILLDAESKQPLTGTTTGVDGTFVLGVKKTNFLVEISFIGFKSVRLQPEVKNAYVNMGTLWLEEDAEQLEEVVVRAEKSTTEFKLDKRVFNVGKDLTSAGASAIEVLNNVPSVNVSIEGAITLRGGQGAQILINGKPSVIASQEGNALGTIVAEQIEKIEVITNPSAKYEAEGTAGIINIVLKKSEKKGLNGAVTLNTGSPNNHSIGLSINKRTQKFNFFGQLGVGKRTFPNTVSTLNRNKVANNEITSSGKGNKHEQFYNLSLGTDYHINDKNVITLSGNVAYEIEDEDSNMRFEEYANRILQAAYTRAEVTEATNPKYQYELQYKKDFERHKEQYLLFSALGSFFGKDQSSIFSNEVTAGTLASNSQRTRTDFKEARYTFKLDYVHPLNDQYTIETGAQYVLNDVSNDYAVSSLIGGNWIGNPGLTNVFEYYQNVLGAYATAAYEGDVWGIKAGLRVENTDLRTVLKTTNQEHTQQYTNLFPSVHTSYKVGTGFSLQAGYSRRIFRPRLWDLNPFFNIRNTFDIFTGNPNLLPEFTDSYELTSIHKIGKASVNFGLYHRYTTDVIEDVSFYNTTTNVTTRRPENFGTNAITGLEANYRWGITKWLTVNGDVNYNWFNRKGQFDAANNFDFNGTRWDTKATAKLKLPAQFDFEMTGNYQSSYKTAQSTIKSNGFVNVGLRKKLLQGKLIVNLGVRDVFATRRRASITDQPTFYSESNRARGRFFTLGVSFGFGKGEAMEYAAQKRF